MNAGRGEKINILFSVPRFSVGGAEKLLVHQYACIDRACFSCSLITIFDEQKDTCADRVHIDACFHFRSTFDLLALFRLYRYLKRERFDVVVTHLFSANLLVRIAAILARVPVIISYEHNIYPNKRRWQILADRFLAKWTARIIVDSEAARVFTSSQESIPLEKFLALYIPPLLEPREGKDPAQLREELGIRSDARVILTVSRLVIDKGHRYLVAAAKSVLARFPNVVFLLVGWGPLEGSLRQQAQELGIADSVKLPGRMDIQDVLPLADIYVDPSISTDLPIAVMEAMREGMAIVATRVGDVPVFIQNDTTGMLIEPKYPKELAASIELLLSDAALRSKLGAGAKKKVKEYSLEEYMRVFEDLVVRLVA